MAQGRENKIEKRTEIILFSVVAEYVATGNPVSSKVLSEKLSMQLSPAAIRRHLHQLTSRGLLVQPHTSAGRIPTDAAFRLFVDAVKQGGSVDPLTQEKIAKGVDELAIGTQTAWRKVVKLLSEVSSHTALMVTPALNDAVLRQLRFIPVSPGKLLAVVVTREGLVHNVYVDYAEQIGDSDLEKIHNYLGDIVANRSLREIRQVLRSELKDARKRCDALQLKATMLGTQAIESSVQETTHIVVEGHSHLLGEPLIQDNINELLQVLEEKTRLLGLLDRAAQTDQGPLIVIGKEGGEPLEGCALISFPFGSAQSEGRIGVIGPTRMDYSNIIPLVSLSAATISKNLGEQED